MKRLLLVIGIVFSCVPLIAQSNKSFSEIKLSDSNNAQYLLQIEEVYAPEIFVNNPNLKDELVQLLGERISFMREPYFEGKDFPLLSSLPLMNKYNSSILPFSASSFSTATFRPLHYAFNFFETKTLWYRLDGTEYVMIVAPFIPGK